MKPTKHKVAALLRHLPCRKIKVSALLAQIHCDAKSPTTGETIEMNDRPHPSPLPQERENRSPSLGVAKASRSSFAFGFDESRRGDRPFDIRKICNGQSLFPLHEPRSSRREEALTFFVRKIMSLLTSAATVQGFNARNSSSGNSLPGGEGQGEGGRYHYFQNLWN